MSMYFASAEELKTLDKRAEENGLEISQMMELSGWHLVTIIKYIKLEPETALILCGKGNKAADALAAARHLANGSVITEIIFAEKEEHLSKEAKHQLSLLKKMGVATYDFEESSLIEEKIASSDIVIDGLIGYKLEGDPREPHATLITMVNKNAKGKVIAYDVPTGLDPTTGIINKHTLKADITISPALARKGVQSASEVTGEVYVVDAGIPVFLYDSISTGSRPAFDGGFVRL